MWHMRILSESCQHSVRTRGMCVSSWKVGIGCREDFYRVFPCFVSQHITSLKWPLCAGEHLASGMMNHGIDVSTSSAPKTCLKNTVGILSRFQPDAPVFRANRQKDGVEGGNPHIKSRAAGQTISKFPTLLLKLVFGETPFL